MKNMKSLTLAAALLAAGTIGAQASLSYDFSSGLDGFQNLTLSPGPAGWAGGASGQMNHASGGWQMLLTKEFAWGPGGGSANQQLEMQILALGDWENTGDPARLAFDIMADASSFPPGVANWFQLNIVGNSDGAKGWTQLDKVVEGWQNADQADLRIWHIDLPFTAVGWDAGDSWFQLWVGSNSDGAFPVNFYVDNVTLSLVPEPTTFTLAGLGALALIISRRRK